MSSQTSLLRHKRPIIIRQHRTPPRAPPIPAAPQNTAAPDRLSNLPELILLNILSFLPSHVAAQTSLISRRFRHLWKATPTLNLDRSSFRLVRRFITVANRSVRLRDRNFRLSHLTINTGDSYNRPLPLPSLSSWISTAYSLGMRHLSLQIHCSVLSSIGPSIFSLKSLESLSLSFVDSRGREESALPPSPIPLIHLKNLELRFACPPVLSRFVRELPCLEYLRLEEIDKDMLNLYSPTVKRLELSGTWGGPAEVRLDFPCLEHMHLKFDLEFAHMIQFHGNLPMLKTAEIKLLNFQREHVPIVRSILSNVANISTLRLCILPVMLDSSPYHLLLEPGKEPSMLPNLKSFDLFTCIRAETVEDIICLLEYLPALEFLKLTRLDPIYKSTRMGRLGHRSFEALESDDASICFTSLHLGKRKAELVNFLSGKRQLSKRLKK